MARDVLLIGVLTFVIAIGLFTLFFVSQTLTTSLVAVPAINQSETTVAVFEGVDTAMNRLDWVVFAVFLGLTLSLMVTTWFVGGKAIFAFFYMIVVVLGVVFSTILANVWESISQSSIFGTTLTAFPITNHLLSYLPIYVSVVGFVGLVVMFAKPSESFPQ